MKQEPWDGWAGNLSQELSFRDEGKLCRACLKRTTADNTYIGKGGSTRGSARKHSQNSDRKNIGPPPVARPTAVNPQCLASFLRPALFGERTNSYAGRGGSKRRRDYFLCAPALGII